MTGEYRKPGFREILPGRDLVYAAAAMVGGVALLVLGRKLWA